MQNQSTRTGRGQGILQRPPWGTPRPARAARAHHGREVLHGFGVGLRHGLGSGSAHPGLHSNGTSGPRLETSVLELSREEEFPRHSGKWGPRGRSAWGALRAGTVGASRERAAASLSQRRSGWKSGIGKASHPVKTTSAPLSHSLEEIRPDIQPEPPPAQGAVTWSLRDCRASCAGLSLWGWMQEQHSQSANLRAFRPTPRICGCRLWGELMFTQLAYLCTAKRSKQIEVKPWRCVCRWGTFAISRG